MNDFVNSFNEIIEKIFDYSDIDRFSAELFKKANYFEFCIEHIKRG